MEDSALPSQKPQQAYTLLSGALSWGLKLTSLCFYGEGIAGQTHHSGKDYSEQSTYFWFESVRSMQKELPKEVFHFSTIHGTLAGRCMEH